MVEDPRLCYVKPWANMRIYKEQGIAANIDFWLAHPQATQHEDEEIRPYEIIRADCRAAVKESVRILLGEKDLGVDVTHGSIVEPCLLALIDTTRRTPIQKISEIGGGLDMAEFAQLTVEESDGGVYTARLSVKDQDFPVDLGKL
jgi:hypothetical protein